MWESEGVRRSLDESIRDLQMAKREDEMINDRLWGGGGERDATPFPHTAQNNTLLRAPDPEPKAELAERNSNTTIRPVPEHIRIPGAKEMPLTPPTSGLRLDETHKASYLDDYLKTESEGFDARQSDDLASYLSAEIDFDSEDEGRRRGREKGRI
jgi:hypothetical protein